MKKEDAVELADKCLKELAASLEQGQTEVLEKYLSVLARFHDYSSDAGSKRENPESPFWRP